MTIYVFIYVCAQVNGRASIILQDNLLEKKVTKRILGFEVNEKGKYKKVFFQIEKNESEVDATFYTETYRINQGSCFIRKCDAYYFK